MKHRNGFCVAFSIIHITEKKRELSVRDNIFYERIYSLGRMLMRFPFQILCSFYPDCRYTVNTSDKKVHRTRVRKMKIFSHLV